MPISMRIVFFVAVVLLHIFIYFMLFKNISPNPAIKHIGKLVVLANFLCIVIFLRIYHSNISPLLYTIISSSIGVFWICVNVSLLVLIARTIIRFSFGNLTLYEWQGKILLIAWIVIVGLVSLSFYINARQPKIEEQDIVIKNLKQPLNIALITDLHIDVLMDKNKVAKIVTQVNDLKPDIIMLSGDIVDNYYKIVQDSVAQLGNLKAKYGIYYALGNHEYHYDTYTILKELNNLGITILVNQNMVLNNLGLNIAGIADLAGSMRMFKDSFLAPNLAKTLSSVNKNYPTILLSHQPKIARYIGNYDVDLILSGHTHGGQLFPFHLLVLLDQPFLSGLHSFSHDARHNAAILESKSIESKSLESSVNEGVFDISSDADSNASDLASKTTQIYISRGTGWWGMPMRLFSRREISLLHLRGE